MQKLLSNLLALTVILGGATRVWAVKIADVTHLYGQQNNMIQGIGMVFGLKGTGDGGDYLPAMKALQSMMDKYNAPATLQELDKSSNVAIVTVQARLPSTGVRRGDKLDVFVMSPGKASSLRGGRLMVTPLTPGANGPVIALAEGAVVIEDPSTPTQGVVRSGLNIEQDLIPPVVINGDRIVLVIEDSAASWGLASTIAKLVNDAEGTDTSGNGGGGGGGGGDGPIATVRDPRTVEVRIPVPERSQPDAFIARVQRLPLPFLPQEARVIINTKTSTIVATSDVEISPVAISYKGLSINVVQPKPVATARTPQVITQTVIPVDTTQQGGAKLQDLVTALEQLKVSADDRINIIKELHRLGRLHAKLIIDGVMP
jgi:flagellar P-ring protein precursor FlgI